MSKNVRKPLGDKYVSSPVTLGDKIRNRRLELHLLQKDIAQTFGVTEDCITNWENNLSQPETRYLPDIIQFLRYIPFRMNLQNFNERLHYYRLTQGFTHKQMGQLFEVDGSTIGAWEQNKHLPRAKKYSTVSLKLSTLLQELKQKHKTRSIV